MAIEWIDSMTTGIPEIDEEHKEWIWRFNKFDNAVINKLGLDSIREALDFFEKYSENHFPHEENRAKHITNPITEINRNQHQDFRNRTREIKAWIQAEGVSLVEVISLKIEMENWLRNHICMTDVQLFTGDK